MSRIHNTCCTPQLLSNTRIAQRYPTSSQQTTLKACMVKNHFHDTSIPAWEQLRCTFRRISRLLLPVQRAESKTIDNHSTHWSYKLEGRHSVTHTGRNLSQHPMTLSKKVKAGQPALNQTGSRYTNYTSNQCGTHSGSPITCMLQEIA